MCGKVLRSSNFNLSPVAAYSACLDYDYDYDYDCVLLCRWSDRLPTRYIGHDR